MKKYSLGSLAILAFTFLLPIPASASQVCNGADCVVSFDYTGTHQQWTIPQGATNIRFFVYGASGARGGGGGSVTGTFTNLPSTVYIFVGGQGSQGRNASGGYNGGGTAGGNRGNEGSGGGASDIRTSLDISTRIVVAGGGGGGGGYSGAAGAPGGGLEAPAGGSGQGGGGGGGTQTAGGGAGFPNGGSPATAGSFGQGGTGGSSWNAGGGGGGGGWYGGGGGGGDDNDCCADGGGGGGGSSYASPNHTGSVTHTIGIQSGHGRIEIHYKLVPVVTNLEGSQVSSTSAVFQLQMSENIQGLTASDFIPSGCQISEILISAAVAAIHLTGCNEGLVTLILQANSVGQFQNGPPTQVSAQIYFDATPPEFTWSEEPGAYSNSPIVISFQVTDATISTLEVFEISGCVAELTEDSVSLSECEEGINSISLRESSLSDNWGNSGPEMAINFSFVYDSSAPQATWSSVESVGSNPFTYSAVLNFNEQVSFSPELVLFSSTSSCETGFSTEDFGWVFWAECGYGSGSWILPAGSVADELGNLGPNVELFAFFDNPEPVFVPEVVEGMENSSESPVSEPATESEPLPNPGSPAASEEQSPTAEEAAPISPVESSSPGEASESAVSSDPVEPLEDSQSIEEPAVEAIQESESDIVAISIPEGIPIEERLEVSKTPPAIVKSTRKTFVEKAIESELEVEDEIPSSMSGTLPISQLEAPAETQLAMSADFEKPAENEFPIVPLGLALIGMLVLGAISFRLSGR